MIQAVVFDVFGTLLQIDELASLESDLFTELASVRLFDDALESLNQLKNAGLTSPSFPPTDAAPAASGQNTKAG